MLKAEDCKSSAAAANIIGAYLDEQGKLNLITRIDMKADKNLEKHLSQETERKAI